MTLPKKGARVVTIGVATYRWRIRRRPTYHQDMGWSPLTIGIQQDTPSPGGVLLVSCLITRPDNAISPHQTGVTPAVIRNIIAKAISDGWRPTSQSPYRMEYPLIEDVIGPA